MLERIVVVSNSTRNIGIHRFENEQDHYPSKNTPFGCVIVSILHLQKCVKEHIVSTKYSCPNCWKCNQKTCFELLLYYHHFYNK